MLYKWQSQGACPPPAWSVNCRIVDILSDHTLNVQACERCLCCLTCCCVTIIHVQRSPCWKFGKNSRAKRTSPSSGLCNTCLPLLLCDRNESWSDIGLFWILFQIWMQTGMWTGSKSIQSELWLYNNLDNILATIADLSCNTHILHVSGH